jgi:predicted nucleotide-binding protein (sugar kinase/HSP70/actin superfamily)
MGDPPSKEDKEARTLELLWIMTRKTKVDLRASIKMMTNILGNNPLKDILKEGRIQYLVLQDKEGGDSWNFFGNKPY